MPMAIQDKIRISLSTRCRVRLEYQNRPKYTFALLPRRNGLLAEPRGGLGHHNATDNTIRVILQGRYDNPSAAAGA